MDGNLSYTDNSDIETGQQNARSAKWLGNLSLLYQFKSDIVFNATYQYTGERERDIEDSREPLKAYGLFNLTASIENIFTSGLTMRAGVKNLFDQEVLYPAALRGVLNYPQDYPRAGRQLWLKASYSF